MEENRDYITVKELAEIQGVSVQSIYQRFNTTLKPYIKVIKGKKCLDIKVLEEVYHLDIKDFKQGFKQDIKGFKQGFKGDNSTDTIKLLQDTLDTLKSQLEQKDIQIAERDKHIEELTKSLQFEQGKTKNLEDRLLLLEDKEPTVEPIVEEPKENKGKWWQRLFS